jgi:hypothetical protein
VLGLVVLVALGVIASTVRRAWVERGSYFSA